MDDSGVYHGHNSACTKYRLADGGKIWTQTESSGVIFGVQVSDLR